MRILFTTANIRPERLLRAAAAAIVLSYAALLAIELVQHRWLLDAQGRPVFLDFVAIWTTGRLVLEGAALSAYDGHLLHAAEIAATGHGVDGYLGWPYPPTFLFVAALLAMVGYVQAFAAWVLATLAVYAGTIRAIAATHAAVLLAVAMPWVAADLFAGQNGFLTAALVGGVLLTLDERPLLSGVLLGLLTYKPQFGILFPFALAAAGRWRALASATVTATILFAAAAAVFGVETFVAFLHGLAQTTQTLVVEGAVGWNKLHSVYGAVRWAGGTDGLARVLQGAVSCACLGAIVLLWRGQAQRALKSAALAGAAVLATPYVFFYDLPVLAVAIAFLYRHRPFDAVEKAALAFVFGCALLFVLFAVPAGLLCALAVTAMTMRRVAQSVAPEPVPGVVRQRG